MTVFPKRASDPEVTGPMLREIADVVQKYLGFTPYAQVLILAHPDGAAKTLFHGPRMEDMRQLLTEALDNNIRAWGN